MVQKDFFKGKKVTQLGLGLLGRGLNDAIFLLENGVENLIVTDKKTEQELFSSVEKLKGFSNLTLRLGGHNIEDFENRDFVLKGAGVPLDSPFILHAKSKNISIEMDASLFVKLLPDGVKTIGVTGTRGKSTTTHLIHHILQKALGSRKLGTSNTEIFLGGNVRDMATLPLIKEVKEGDLVVLELDSWQLQGFGESKISPHISVFTNFMEDHMNYYGGDMNLYFNDKANIFKYQNNNDVLVVGEMLSQSSYFKNQNLNAQVKIAKNDLVPKSWDIKLIGEHNIANISCAIEACRAFGISEDKIKEGVESFVGVEGRLQFVKEINGVKIWNDNNATTPEAAVVALEALKENIILFCGGADKNIPIDELVEKINKSCKAIILLPGSGSEKIKNQKSKIKIEIKEVKSLEEGVKKALQVCVSGDNLLFSPAFASFGLFKNEYDRNDQFLDIVNRI